MPPSAELEVVTAVKNYVSGLADASGTPEALVSKASFGMTPFVTHSADLVIAEYCRRQYEIALDFEEVAGGDEDEDLVPYFERPCCTLGATARTATTLAQRKMLHAPGSPETTTTVQSVRFLLDVVLKHKPTELMVEGPAALATFQGPNCDDTEAEWIRKELTKANVWRNYYEGFGPGARARTGPRILGPGLLSGPGLRPQARATFPLPLSGRIQLLRGGRNGGDRLRRQLSENACVVDWSAWHQEVCASLRVLLSDPRRVSAPFDAPRGLVDQAPRNVD